MDPSYNNGNGSNAGGQTDQPGGIFSRNESGGTTGVSGAAGVPGAKPGVIASGPDPADMPDEKPAGLSLGSNRHLFRRPRAQAPRNFVMNVGGGAGAGMGAGAGRKSGGPKKGLIIGGLAVVVILIVALVVGMMLSQNKNGNNNGSGGSQNNTIVEPSDSTNTEETEEPEEIYTGVNEDFYKYANYILNGKTTARKNLGKYNADKKYAIDTAVTEKNSKFFENALKLWKAFYDRFSNNADLQKEVELKNNVDSQNLMINFLSEYVTIKDYSEEETWKMYAESGLENTIKTVRTDYEKLYNSTFSAGAVWAKAKADWAEAALRLYDGYNSKGCVEKGSDEFNQDCINKNAGDLKDLLTKFTEANLQLEDSNFTVENLAKELAKNVFSVKDGLNEE